MEPPSMTAHPKPPRFDSKKYAAFVRANPLIHGPDIIQAHVRVFCTGGVGKKPPDTYSVGMPRDSHDLQHKIGEDTFWNATCGEYWREILLRHMLDNATRFLQEGK